MPLPSPEFGADRAVDSPSSGIPPSGAPELRNLLHLALAVAVVAALLVAQDVLIPIVLAVLVSFVLSPAVTALGKAGLSRAPSVLVTVLLTFGLFVLVATLLANQASTIAADAPRYAATIQDKLQGAEQFAAIRVGVLTRLFGIAKSEAPLAGSPPPAIARRPAAPSTLAAAAAANGQPVPVQIARGDTSPLLAVRAILEPVLGPVEKTVIVLVIAIFILMEREDLRDRVIRVAGSNDLHRTTAAMDDAAQRLSRYFLSQVAVNSAFALVIGLGLWAIGIPSPALWGVLAGLLRFVPYIGPILAAVPPLALGAATDPGWWRTGEVALLFVAVEPATAYVVEPLLYGHSTGLAPLSVIVAAVFWTWIWGPIGLILSTPLTLCLVVMGRHVRSLEFFDVLLGDRPPLAPAETVYQRILSDNADDVLEKAEALLTERTLLEYYDGVVLPALVLAAQDEARGAIGFRRASVMTRTILDVIDDLADHEDPAAATGPDGTGSAVRQDSSVPVSSGSIACVAGDSPFDDAVVAMLSQLLGRRGFATRRVPHADVSRERIATLDLSGVAVVAVCSVGTSESTARLRFLVRRIRQHAPAATVVVGRWQPGGSIEADADRRRAIGAHEHVASLADAVDAASRAARQPGVRPA